MIQTFSQVGIVNANTRTVQDSFSPVSMRSALMGYFRPLALTIISKKKVGMDWVDVARDFIAQGVVQQLGDEELKILPEGERSWKWKMIHCTPDLVLRTDDNIVYRGLRYDVMDRRDFEDYGYVKYMIVNKYTDASRV